MLSAFDVRLRLVRHCRRAAATASKRATKSSIAFGLDEMIYDRATCKHEICCFRR